MQGDIENVNLCICEMISFYSYVTQCRNIATKIDAFSAVSALEPLSKLFVRYKSARVPSEVEEYLLSVFSLILGPCVVNIHGVVPRIPSLIAC